MVSDMAKQGRKKLDESEVEKPKNVRNREGLRQREWGRGSWGMPALMKAENLKDEWQGHSFCLSLKFKQNIYPYALHLRDMMRNFPANRHPDNDKPNPH